jgi:hypothetical protein
MYAIRRTLLPIILCVCASIAQAQWEVGPNLGAAIPVTGYGEVVKPGYLIGIDGKYRLKDDFSLGMEFTFARLVEDKDDTDSFDDARLTMAPLLVVRKRNSLQVTSSRILPRVSVFRCLISDTR